MSAELFDLSGQVALCTGGSSGIGRRMAGALSRAGANVVLIGRRAEVISEAVAEINDADSGKAAGLVADLLDRDSLAGLVREAATHFGPTTILANAAGINPRQAWHEIATETWDETLKLNLSIPFFLARECVPAMKEKGEGRIINIASLQSYRAFEDGMPYGASKGGITQLTRAMAEAWSRFGITANAVAPGFFRTPLTAPVFDDPERSAHHAARTAIGRNGELEDLDGVTVFLASKASSYITGQVIAVDGGYMAK